MDRTGKVWEDLRYYEEATRSPNGQEAAMTTHSHRRITGRKPIWWRPNPEHRTEHGSRLGGRMYESDLIRD